MTLVHAYQIIDNGFMISLNLSLYARPAVMKALYRYHDLYIISYELVDNQILVYFESSNGIDNIDDVVSEIMKELSFQMIRFDTMRITNNVRQLLVARALYASCIEEERSIDIDSAQDSSENWTEDSRNIFSSWSAEQ